MQLMLDVYDLSILNFLCFKPCNCSFQITYTWFCISCGGIDSFVTHQILHCWQIYSAINQTTTEGVP